MTFTETTVTEDLDQRGLLDTARNPGVYALALQTPADDADTVTRRWRDEFDAMPDGLAGHLAACDALLYVGSHRRSVYERVCQHARGHHRAAIMAVWPPERVVGIEPCENPRAREWGYAASLADETTRCWTDGELR